MVKPFIPPKEKPLSLGDLKKRKEAEKEAKRVEQKARAEAAKQLRQEAKSAPQKVAPSPEAGNQEGKRVRGRGKAAEEPVATLTDPLKVANPALREAAEEARAMPYEPPSYHFGPNDDPLAELAQRELCRRKLLPFIQRFRPKYVAGWVHEDICRRIERFVERVENKEEPRLLLMMPPRSGKSEISSRHTPGWILGKHPDWEIIAASHTSSLSLSFSRYLRDVMRDPAYTAVFPDACLDPSSQSVENWNLTKGGGYLAAGVGTGITGRGANVLLLDDLVKDIEAADSITIRDNTWEWYLSTAYTRLAPGGGVLGLMCMTGDTPVMMADGSQRPLETLCAGENIATYIRGTLGQSRVAAVKSSGIDSVYKMTMSSGKIVRANQRHPFLTVSPIGEISWTRLKNLTTAHRIVTVKGSGANGEALSALPRGAKRLPSVADFATVTMPSSAGQRDTAHGATTTSRVAMLGSNTAMGLPQLSTTPCTKLKADAAQSVESQQKQGTRLPTGQTSSLSTTATTQGKCAPSSATTATQESDTLVLNQWHLPPLGISDFTLDKILSIEYDCEEEVFDVQVDDTENFIANGLVSHNTWWHDDDWAGRIQQAMNSGDGDKFEIIRYPAINDQGDEYILADDSIIQIPEGFTVPEGARLTRRHNTAVHPARYTTEAMLRIKRNLVAGGQKRVWDALYQQNPVPDEGNYFSKEMFTHYSTPPARSELRVYQAWDFAISTGKESDFTVGMCIGIDHRDCAYVLDLRRFRSDDSFMIVDTMLDFYDLWKADMMGAEDGQIWKAIESQFLKRCDERRIYPSYEVLKPLTDKMVRANPLRGRMQLNKVYFPKEAGWLQDLTKEMLYFPAGKHDDQIDALAWAIRLSLMYAPPKQEIKEPKVESWKKKLAGLMGERGATWMSA